MPDAVATAPGRVNLLGEHTDYHDGFVLPVVIPQLTTVALTGRHDRTVTATTGSRPGARAGFTLGRESRQSTWIDYLQGVTLALQRRGFTHPGFDVHVESDIPEGAGLSSSAALEVSLLRGLRDLFDLAYDDVELARIARAAETDFVGAPVGIMDQMAASVGDPGTALFLDTQSLAFERVPLIPGTRLVVIDSGLRHAHAGGAYRDRRAESFDAARLLGVGRLRSVTVTELPRIAALPAVQARRARHIVTENQRVLDGVAALRASDAPALGQLFDASHASMRDDYEISVPAIDRLVALAREADGVFGARMTGGGFGGCVIALATAAAASAAAAHIATAYAAATGRRPQTIQIAD